MWHELQPLTAISLACRTSGLWAMSQSAATTTCGRAGAQPKVICDHLGLGVQELVCHIWHSKANGPFTNLRKGTRASLAGDT
jgi:hypothetical protein